MPWIQTVLSSETERELLRSTSRRVIYIVAGIYAAWHFIATLGWPDVFSPSLWACTGMMVVLVTLTLKLLDDHYLLAHAFWLTGLTAVIFTAYGLYGTPDILLLLVFLPLMAIVTLGYAGAALTVGGILLSVFLLPRWLPAVPPVPAAYRFGVVLGSIFTSLFGWGLSSNLFTALDSASFHFREARKHLEETRHHRAEVSRMLKELNQTNYQLERLNLMLQQARRRTEDARADRDRFILAVSHELRSPLNFIIGFSDLMVNSPETYAPLDAWPPGLYDDAQEIYRSSRHLLTLINDILDMGQVDARRMTLFRQMVNLETIVDEVRQMVRAAFEQKGLDFIVRAEPDLPEVFVDATRIRQVLLNLVNNGLRFTDRGSVTVSLQRAADKIQVSVADTGAGIAPEDIPKVFDDFRQVGVDNWRRREGSGLGLSISRRFVQLHGGEMWLESELGRGATFYFTLPVPEAAQEPELPAGDEHGSPPRGFYRRLLHSRERIVLLCSPDPMAREIAQGWLDEYRVVRVAGPDALPEQIRARFPQAVLVDKMFVDPRKLPFQAFAYELPVIGVIFPSTRARHAMLPQGVRDYLVKPVSRADLVRVVHQLDTESPRLLLVDDDPAMVRFVEQSLKSGADTDPALAALEILTALSGADALQTAAEQRPDVILLDLDLPDMTGWDVLAALMRREGEAAPPVVIVSAHDLPQVLFGSGQAVLDLTLRRPLSQQELPEVLRALLAEVEPDFREREK